MTTPRSVTIFTGSSDSAGLLDGSRQSKLPVEQLRDNLKELTDALKEMLPAADSATHMRLSSVSVAVGIDGKGKVGFLGTGIEAGAQATLTLNFEF